MTKERVGDDPHREHLKCVLSIAIVNILTLISGWQEVDTTFDGSNGGGRADVLSEQS